MAPRLRPLIAGRTAAKPFVSDARTARSIDYAALTAAVDAWAGELTARAVPAGGRVLLDIDDPLAFAVAHLAVVAAGRCSAPVDPAAPATEAVRTRRVVAPALVLTDRPDGSGVPVTPDGLPAAPVGAPSGTDGGTGSVLLLTSGSTGTPKAVALSEEQCLHVARAVAAHHRLTSADRGFCPLPLFHVNAQVVGLLATLVRGWGARARPAVPAHRLLAPAGRAGRHLGERRASDPDDPRQRPRRARRGAAAAVRALGVRRAAPAGA